MHFLPLFRGKNAPFLSYKWKIGALEPPKMSERASYPENIRFSPFSIAKSSFMNFLQAENRSNS